MIRKRTRFLYHWLNGHPLLAFLIIAVLVVAPGYFRLESIARCGQEYAQATSEANAPVRAASQARDDAEDDAWDKVRAILSQQADQDDYEALRAAVRERDALSDKLDHERDSNPYPEPPSTFC